MLIGIDASRAFRPQRTGTERYSLETIRHILRLPEAEGYQWRLYVDDCVDRTIGEMEYDFLEWGGAPNVEIRQLASRRMWTHRALSHEVLNRPPDVLFVPSHVIPFVLPPSRLPPCVVTVHDLGYRAWPEMHTRSQRIYLEFSTRWSAAVARRVICVSQATADDLRQAYGTDAAKIDVVHEGIDLRLAKKAKPDRKGPPERPYALYVGTIQPRKNLARLMQAYANLVTANSVDWDLVLAGKPGSYSDTLYQLADDLNLAHRIHLPGYVPDDVLPSLLSNARFFCFPSLHEGFGLPVLEAQAMGVPLVTANNSSLPEIAGDAALLVDPTDIDAIADAMLQLSQDEDLRQQLIVAGFENIKRFSWEKAAAETLAVLEQAAKDGNADD